MSSVPYLQPLLRHILRGEDQAPEPPAAVLHIGAYGGGLQVRGQPIPAPDIIPHLYGKLWSTVTWFGQTINQYLIFNRIHNSR